MKVEIKGSLGEFNYAEMTLDTTDDFVVEATNLVNTKVKKEIHHISHTTEQSIYSKKTGRHQAEVRTGQMSKPYALVLEFKDAPFMRPGARKAKRGFNKLVKKVFGEGFRARTRTRGRQTKYVKKLRSKLRDTR